MGYELRGGKLAPRLLQDILSYNPQKLDHGALDVLSEIPFHDASLEDNDPPLPDASCRHHWSKNQGETSVSKSQATPQGAQCLRSFCVKCRCHLEWSVEYADDNTDSRPCPTVNRPLHHLKYKRPQSPATTAAEVRRPSPSSARSFECTAKECGLSITVQFQPPRLKHEWVTLLTDKHIIKKRFETAVANEPDKFLSHAPATPGNVLEYLWRLVNKALTETNIRPIPNNGKQFLLNLGGHCTGILEGLGFTSDGVTWHFPILDPPARAISGDSLRLLLEDVTQEILALMLARPDDERRASKLSFTPSPCIANLRSALGCETYKKRIGIGPVNMDAPEHPCYAGLGSIADLHDDLIVFGYERQIAVDIANLPYYLECLQTIADGRESEELGTRVAIEASHGRVSLKDIRDAYQRLGVNYHEQNLLDDTILGIFQARLSDAPKQENELRQYLRTIGHHRGSSRLQSAAASTVNDYEQALSFLDTTPDTPDGFIVSCFAVKLDTKSSDEAMARRAVAIIANHRKSKALRQWLETGVLGEVEMDISQAYARLNIQDRTTEDEMIITSYRFEAEEQPSQVEELKRALATIAKSRNSQSLMSLAGIDNNDDDEKVSVAEWPVALNNIGNTCYLNSLLQFYFSIKPFRDLVLNIENFKSPLDHDHILTKRIGGRNVSRKEVQRAQHTADELKKLFSDLITSPYRAVRPDTELARVTLLTPKAENARRQSIRQSSTAVSRPIITLSPETDPQSPGKNPADQQTSNNASDPPSVKLQRGDLDEKVIELSSRNSSSETLVNGLTEGTEEEAADKRATQPQAAITVSNSRQSSYLPGSSDSNAIELPSDEAGKDSSRQEPGFEADTATLKAPNQPPPIPPRPKLESNSDDPVKEAEFAAQQQDVNEIAYNILNQLQCAIRPLSLDSEGEQIDQIKRIFYGTQKTYITNQSGEVRTKEEYMSDVRVSVPSGPTDIYAALDGAFDVEDVIVAGGIEPKYSTINSLPPVLQIHIQRSQYDTENKKQFKSVAHIELQEVIYMDRYMDTTDKDILRQREESWAWKRELADLKLRRDRLLNTEVGLPIPDAINCACEYLHRLQEIEEEPKIQVPGALVDELERAAREAQSEINDIEGSIEKLEARISLQFSALKEIPYRLAAVFMHRGSTNAGHYWIYIYDFEHSLWRSYNDESVSKVKDVGDIFKPPTGDRPPTPYFLVYVQDDIKGELVNPLCRQVDKDAIQVDDTVAEEYEQISVGDQPSALNGWDDSSMTGGGW